MQQEIPIPLSLCKDRDIVGQTNQSPGCLHPTTMQKQNIDIELQIPRGTSKKSTGLDIAYKVNQCTRFAANPICFPQTGNIQDQLLIKTADKGLMALLSNSQVALA